ncbi:Ammonia transport outward protein 2 [Beauveria bassiana]|uniref:Ammonia transport outward protein 2 n=1 Tax=Beauveria bassiana TaxID=176275 RepID=A0A2N6NP17_BEABA|nr:Ammonia transport outward protein 2 [Beauveria bassiana]
MTRDATISEAGDAEGKVVVQREPVQYHKHLPSSAESDELQSAFPIGAFATTLTTLSLSLMEWRGVTILNVYVANFFFVAALGLLISAQWELSVGNGFAYTVYSAFGYGAILTPSFGIRDAYADDVAQYNNALGFFLLLWTIFILTFLVASITSNLVSIMIYLFVDIGFLLTAASSFAKADGYTSAGSLQIAGGANLFIAGLLGWYLVFHLLLKDELVELPLGDTSKYFVRKRAHRTENNDI